jgi:peptidoglycan L-alanyl-D-glutamate endopeptidase CwlK
MPAFSERSKKALASAHPKLRALFEEVVKTFDCSILYGFRGQAEQNEAVARGLSTKPWPTSMHNKYPSMAIDAAPYPIDWKDRERFYFFAGYVLRTAETMGIKIRLGLDWDQDHDLKDQTLFDLDHFELVEEEAQNPTV